MLRYFNFRTRGDDAFVPILEDRRLDWEFYLVLEGSCQAVFEFSDPLVLQAGDLVAFRPDCPHGWMKFRSCLAACLHYSSVPPVFDRLMEKRRYARVRHNQKDWDLNLVERLDEIKRHRLTELDFSPLIYGSFLCYLCLLFAPELTEGKLQTMNRDSVRLVNDAVSWFEANLEANPKVDSVAAFVGVSPGHLRRLCRSVHGKSPKEVFDQVRIQRAKELMAESIDTLDTISRYAGFASATEFCRVFKRMEKGLSPARWRKSIFATCK